MRHLELQKSRRSALRAIVFLPLAAALVLTAGCGKGSKDKVTGTVMLGDNPVSGSVVFKGDKEYEAPINSKGEYTVIGLPKGSYKVFIKAGLTGGSTAIIPPGGQPDMPGIEKTKPQVAPPKAATDPGTSGITFEHEGGPKEFAIVLKGVSGQ